MDLLVGRLDHEVFLKSSGRWQEDYGNRGLRRGSGAACVTYERGFDDPKELGRGKGMGR